MRLSRLYNQVDSYDNAQKGGVAGFFRVFQANDPMIEKVKEYLKTLKSVGGSEVEPWEPGISYSKMKDKSFWDPDLTLKDIFPLVNILIDAPITRDENMQREQGAKGHAGADAQSFHMLLTNELLTNYFNVVEHIRLAQLLYSLKQSGVLNEVNFIAVRSNVETLNKALVSPALLEGFGSKSEKWTQARFDKVIEKCKLGDEAVVKYVADEVKKPKILQDFQNISASVKATMERNPSRPL